MRIGIDISQTAYAGTGVANYVQNLVESLLSIDDENEYVLFYSSLRRNFKFQTCLLAGKVSNFPVATSSSVNRDKLSNKNITIKKFKIPPTLLDILWNKLHIVPIEWFIGDIDVFISSDWTQPPVKNAKNITILYDVTVYKYPEETAKKIIDVQKRKLHWVKKECDMILCISEATKKDAVEILKIPEKKLVVVYPGI